MLDRDRLGSLSKGSHKTRIARERAIPLDGADVRLDLPYRSGSCAAPQSTGGGTELGCQVPALTLLALVVPDLLTRWRPTVRPQGCLDQHQLSQSLRPIPMFARHAVLAASHEGIVPPPSDIAISPPLARSHRKVSICSEL